MSAFSGKAAQSAQQAQPLSDTARAEAAAWIARLHGPARSAELEAGFRRWLATDPQNAQAFEGMTEIWDAVIGATPGRFPRVHTWGRARPSHSRMLLAATILAIVGSSVAYLAYLFWRDPTYVTAVGQRRRIELADGSHISLNSNSRLVVLYRNDARRVQLQQGEALFEVAASARRPFVVVAGDREVTALGTSFVVRQDPDRTAVTLVDGRVTISSTDVTSGLSDAAPPARMLHPGERVTITALRTEKLDTPSVDSITAWRRGEVMFDHTPLDQAAQEMNRYDPVALVVENPAAAKLHVSGNYKTGDSEGFARAIANMYGLELREQDGRLYLR